MTSAVLTQRCAELLGLAPDDVKKQYTSYCRLKRAQLQQPLELKDFLATKCIAKLDKFAESHPQLLFDLMKDGAGCVPCKPFLYYAPKVMLATEFDSANIFARLSDMKSLTGGSGGSDGGDELKRDASHDSCLASFEHFQQYISALSDVRNGLAGAESFLKGFSVVDGKAIIGRHKVVYMSSVPFTGRLMLSTSHICFESKTLRKQKVVQLKDFISVQYKPAELLWQEHMHVTYRDNGEVATADFGFDPLSDDVETSARTREIRTWIRLVEVWAEKEMILKRAVLDHPEIELTFMPAIHANMQHVLALAQLRHMHDPMAACLIKGSDRELSDAFVTKLTESWMRKDVARRSRGYLQPFQEAVLALSSGNNMLEEIDPELALNMTRRANAVSDVSDMEFSPEVFLDNAKELRRQLEALFAFFRLLSALIEWQYPVVSGFTFWFLLYLVYRDWVGLVPALCLMAHTIILLVNRPNGVEPPMVAHAKADDDKETDKVKEEEVEVSIWDRFQAIKDGYDSTKEGLTNTQRGLFKANVQLLKLRGLYTWANEQCTALFVIMSLAGAVVLALLPIRLSFGAAVIYLFTSKWHSQPGLMDKILFAIPVEADHLREKKAV